MDLKRWSLPIRIAAALILGFFLLKFIFSGTAHGQPLSPMDRFFGLVAAMFYGLTLFALFGWSFIEGFGERLGSSLFMPRDENFQITPEYSVAEARAAVGKYQEAIDEYRKVIAKYPEDVYPHLRIAEIAVKSLNDVKLAEMELVSAVGKAAGEDSTALAAVRLADLYQLTLQDPARALEVMKQLRERIPGTKQAALAEERITVLEGIVHGGVALPKLPDKIAHRPSRYKMSE